MTVVPLGSSRLPAIFFGSARVNILGIACRGAGNCCSVGETIGTSLTTQSRATVDVPVRSPGHGTTARVNLAATALLALAMFTNAFAAAAGEGIALQMSRWSEMVWTN